MPELLNTPRPGLLSGNSAAIEPEAGHKRWKSVLMGVFVGKATSKT
jgi:hypothetical protein